jgi:hypothetical protein
MIFPMIKGYLDFLDQILKNLINMLQPFGLDRFLDIGVLKVTILQQFLFYLVKVHVEFGFHKLKLRHLSNPFKEIHLQVL